MKKKIYIIGSVGIPARYGGFETFAEQTANAFSDNYDITVICSSKVYNKKEQSPYLKRTNRVFIPNFPNGISSILYDIRGIRKSKKSADILLLLGTSAGLFLSLFMPKVKKKVWLHLDGVEWKRKKWNFLAKTFLFYSFQVGIRSAHKILIDNEDMKRIVPRKFHSKIVLLTYGGDHIPRINDAPLLKFPYALMIARAEPENNLELVISAFLKWGKSKLVIVTNWEQTKYGLILHKKYSEHPLIEIIAANYKQEVLQNYRIHSKYYIHAHSAGGTNPSLVEAMYSQRPIFAFDNSFNRITSNQLAFYFKSVDELLNLLESTSIKDMDFSANALFQFAKKNYTWQKVVETISQNIL